MDIEYDPIKSAKNERERGFSFALMEYFSYSDAHYTRDLRHIHEIRYKAVGMIDGNLYTAIITQRENAVRVISLRNSSRKERSDYETRPLHD